MWFMLRCRVLTYGNYLPQSSLSEEVVPLLLRLALVAWYCEVDAMRDGQDASILQARLVIVARRGRRKGGP